MNGPINLCCEHLINPFGIDVLNPRLSWQLNDKRTGACQTAYQITAASCPELLKEKPDLWDSGKINSDQCLDIVYSGKKLVSRRNVCWRVRIWDQDKKMSEWSGPANFEIGLLKAGDWACKWIGRPMESKEGSQPSPYLRRKFTLKDNIRKARIYVTSRGLFELYLNGRRVGQDFFTPGWTDYRKRIEYLVYDVTDMLKTGANAVGAILGEGWYSGVISQAIYGRQLSLLLQLEVEYENGTKENIITDSEWKTSLGPIISSDIYNGETYDAGREMPGWEQPSFDDSPWQKAVVFDAPAADIVSKRNQPVRKQEELTAVSQTEPSFGAHVFDLGQNMVGWARIKVRVQKGGIVTIRYAEMLNSDGTLHVENLRSAKSTEEYICCGGVEEVYEPRFTFHGFRYVELSGLREKPSTGDVTGIVLHSDIPTTGSFECSDRLVNRLQQNIVWSQKGNFLEVPSDCPQRDERHGWTGDAQVFIRTACFNMDVSAFFTRWCIDMAEAQYPDGQYPHVIPHIIKDQRSCSAWADAGIICPWTIFLCYNDTEILRRQYKSMARWVEWQRKHSSNFILNNACFGDWLAIDLIKDNPYGSLTPRDLISTAYFAKCTELLAKTAGIIGNKNDAKKYAMLHKRIRSAFNREFVTGNGRVLGETQTSYLLALGFGMLPAEKQAYALERLVENIKSRGWHLSTGFVGTPLIMPVLTRFNRVDVAYKLLIQKEYPSWLYMVEQGSTTMWERWNSYTKENGFCKIDGNSFNHYAYGSMGEWLYNTVAGIDLDPDEPGYKHIIIRPQPGGGLTWARGELMTRFGRAVCAWKTDNNRLKVKVTIPPNTHATVILPDVKPEKITAGTCDFNVRYLYKTGR